MAAWPLKAIGWALALASSIRLTSQKLSRSHFDFMVIFDACSWPPMTTLPVQVQLPTQLSRAALSSGAGLGASGAAGGGAGSTLGAAALSALAGSGAGAGSAAFFFASWARREGAAGFAKVVAVKRILPHLSTLPDFVAMFMDEARLAARLTHPHIVQIYDFGEAEGIFFIAMEYVPGEDLLAILRRARDVARPVPAVLGATILTAACEALHHAHELRDDQG